MIIRAMLSYSSSQVNTNGSSNLCCVQQDTQTIHLTEVANEFFDKIDRDRLSINEKKADDDLGLFLQTIPVVNMHHSTSLITATDIRDDSDTDGESSLGEDELFPSVAPPYRTSRTR